MTTPTTITLPSPPSVNRVWRTTRTGKVYCDPKYAAWRKAAWWEIAAQRPGKFKLGEPVAITIRIGKATRARDIDNYGKALLDALQASGTLANDRDVHDMRVHRDTTVPAGRVVVEMRTITKAAAA
jgi:crossover junction endodeoxyribonuclease RusA